MTLILLAPATTALQSYFGLANAIHTLQMSWYNSELTAFSSLNNLNSSITQVMRLENVLFFTFALMHSIICKYYHIEGLPCVLCRQSSLSCLHSFVPENTEALCLHHPPSSHPPGIWLPLMPSVHLTNVVSFYLPQGSSVLHQSLSSHWKSLLSMF